MNGVLGLNYSVFEGKLPNVTQSEDGQLNHLPDFIPRLLIFLNGPSSFSKN